jgi:hypothetical protein
MVSEMQSNAARKAHRTVIGRTLGGRPTFKTFVIFTSTTLLTHGYFLISFENEEGAIATRKLTTVDWSGLSLSFSRFSPDFNSSAQGAKALLKHTIKVQFPDLHEQFKNAKALTIMASKLEAVLEIEAAKSYIKRPVGPMVTVEVQDISRLAGFIRIPSMAEGAPTTNSIWQIIIYSGLPNQCRKCRQFGHHAGACNVTIARPREGPPQHIPTRGENKGEGTGPRNATQGAAHARGPKLHANTPSDLHSKRGGKPRAKAPGARLPSPQAQPQLARHDHPHSESSEQVSNQRRLTGNEMKDQEMSDPSRSPTSHKEGVQPNAVQPKDDVITLRAKLQFGLQDPTRP